MTDKLIPFSSGLRTHDTIGRSVGAPGAEGELAASLAHEINNPLDALLNLLYLMEPEARLTETGRHYLMLAREEVRHISHIAHSALHELRDTVAPATVNLPTLLGSVLELYKSRLDSRGISIHTRFCDHGDLSAYTGPLRQIFSNLVLNAVDAMPHGGRLQARISTAHEWTGSGRAGLRITFADNGCGIPADQLPKVLEPFFTTKGAAGNGLGLSLVHDVVERHHGVLRVRSSTKAGHSGTVFFIFLPAA